MSSGVSSRVDLQLFRCFGQDPLRGNIYIFEKLKEEYIDKGLVKFEHHAFPLDLAALNAEVIVRCQENNAKNSLNKTNAKGISQ